MRVIRNTLYAAGVYVLAILLLYPLTATKASAQLYNPPSLPVQAQVQSMDVVLNTTGDATWTYPVPFPDVPDVTHLPQAVNATDMVICNYTARTATSVSVHCLRVNPLAALLGGLTGGTLAGIKVNLIARYRPVQP